MKIGPRFFLVALALCLTGGTFGFVLAARQTKTVSRSSESELEWLRYEYHLNPVQFTAIQDLHHRYQPRCEDMYRAILDADRRAEHLISSNHAVTADVTAALDNCARVHDKCAQAALTHIYAVAEHMTPSEGNRFIAEMKYQILEPGTVHQTASHWPR